MFKSKKIANLIKRLIEDCTDKVIYPAIESKESIDENTRFYSRVSDNVTELTVSNSNQSSTHQPASSTSTSSSTSQLQTCTIC